MLLPSCFCPVSGHVLDVCFNQSLVWCTLHSTAEMPGHLPMGLVREVSVLVVIEIMTAVWGVPDDLFDFFFLVWMYQGKKQRQEKEAKRFKGKEFSWVVILQSPVTVVNMLVRRNSSWSRVEHLVWVSTYETPWGWQQNRVGRKVPVFLSGLPSPLLRCRWCPETCWPVGTPGPARYWKMAGEDTRWQSVASTHMHTHVLGHLQKPINTHTHHRIHALTEKKSYEHTSWYMLTSNTTWLLRADKKECLSLWYPELSKLVKVMNSSHPITTINGLPSSVLLLISARSPGDRRASL